MKRFLAALLAALVPLSISPRPLRAEVSFPDVPRDAWYYPAVEAAAERGWMVGVGDGTFAPGRSLGCHEFLALLIRALFPDLVPASSAPWYRGFCEAALQAGLLEGTDLLPRLRTCSGDWEQAGVGSPLNRLEMTQMLRNALALRGKDLQTSPEDPLSAFADQDAIPLRYRPAAAVCVQAGLLRGNGDGRFDAAGTVNRAQGAAVLCRLCQAATGEPLQTDPLPEPILRGLQEEMLHLVNLQRTQAGQNALVLDRRLCSAAQIRADEITGVFEHTRPDGSGCFTVLDSLGILRETAGENIARGYDTPEEVVTGWINSPDHRLNILDPSFHHLGVGCVVLGRRTFWVQLFTG